MPQFLYGEYCSQFSCQFDNKTSHHKSFSNTEFSHQYLQNFFLAISELALFHVNNYTGLVTFLSSGYSNDLIKRNTSFLWFIEKDPFEWTDVIHICTSYAHSVWS